MFHFPYSLLLLGDLDVNDSGLVIEVMLSPFYTYFAFKCTISVIDFIRFYQDPLLFRYFCEFLN